MKTYQQQSNKDYLIKINQKINLHLKYKLKNQKKIKVVLEMDLQVYKPSIMLKMPLKKECNKKIF